MENDIYIYRQQTIFQEQTWVSLTAISVNAFLIGSNSGINKYLIILTSIFISCLAMYIILKRANAYNNVNHEYSKAKPEDFSVLKTVRFIIKEKSGALFYFSLVLFSMVGVVLSKFYFFEIIRNWHCIK